MLDWWEGIYTPSTLPPLSWSRQGLVGAETCHVPALSLYEGRAGSFCDVADPAWLYPNTNREEIS